MGQYIYSVGETALYVYLFISNEVCIEMETGEVKVSLETKFPFENLVRIKVSHVPDGGMTLAVRIPEYAGMYQMTAKGQLLEYKEEKGYAYLALAQDADISISFEAPAKFVRANPKVRADCGKTAVVKGPLVYCLEEIDNGKNLAELYVDTEKEIQEVPSELFGGITELVLQGKRMEESAWDEKVLYGEHPVKLSDVTLKAIPYAYWNNRGMGEMAVWVKELISG